MEKVVRIFNSFEEEEKAEYARRASMTIEERLNEFGAIQERVWGELWTKRPIEKKVEIEELPWAKNR